VLDAENDAIAIYKKLIKASEGSDPVTADLAPEILADEEAHRTLFDGFAKSLAKNSRT